MAVYTAIDSASSFFNPVLYTGTGSSLAVTGAGFQPDFTWIKNRDAADFHVLTDAVRGATKYVQSNTDAAEVTNAESLKSFDSDGFTAGTQAEVNTNTEDFASWNWKAGTTTGIAGSPSITPTAYSFNQTAGFSIITYLATGSNATLPHGLGVAPKWIFIKSLNDTYQFATYHVGTDRAAPEDYYMAMNTTAARVDAADYWNDTAPTSTLFSIGTDNVVNNPGSINYVAYCFANVVGYSNMGSYFGNGNVKGPYVYTGFRPAFIIAKKTSDTGNWFLWDAKRLGYNANNNYLMPSTTGAESAATNIDILSNGFKIRSTDTELNAASADYIYMAFAEAPFVNSSGVPVNAR